ncbi:MAG: DUF1987 domain-containing protein [Bacteroidales bacterium]|nr:MAG: DUF1987 domain-containing protein [Bacteroidales bacterium]
MESLYINSYPDLVFFPIVDFKYQTGVCEISGESYMEDTYSFYEPVIIWLREYMQEKKPIIFNVKLTYFNTSSSRFILEMLDLFKKYLNEGNQVIVNWYYKKDDPDMLTEINELIDESGVDINIYTVTLQ